jgi:hypothetical protein
MPEMTRRQALTAVSAAAAGGAVAAAMRRAQHLVPETRSGLALDTLTSDLLLLPPAGSAWFGAYPGPGNTDPNAGSNPYEGSTMANRQLNCWYRYYAFTSNNIPSTDDETLCAAGRHLVMALTSSFTAPAAAGPLTKVAAGSNGVNVNTFTGSGVLHANTTGYPTSGTIAVVLSSGAVVTITYTGVTGSAFTGCTTTSGSGTLATGNQMGIAYSYAAVTAGAYDSQMTAIANRAKSMLPNAWFLAFTPEPDISARLGYGTGAQYVSAFQHVATLFRSICGQGTGAGNVVTMWDISAPGATAAAFYPGDAYTDWICADPYDPSLKKGSPQATYTPFITWLNSDPLSATGGAGSGGGHGKPLGINETGVDYSPEVDGPEAEWIQAVPACLASLMTTWGSQIRLWQWFNSNGTLGDTAIPPGSASAAALAEIGASSFFNQKPVYLVTSASSNASVTSDVLTGLNPTRPGDTIVVPIMGPYGIATVAGVSDSKGNIYKQAGATDTQFDTSVWVATQGPGGGSNPTAALTASDSITVDYSNSTGAAGRNIAAAAVANVAAGTTAAVKTTDGKSTTPSASTGTLAAPAAVLAFESNQAGGGAIAWSGALAGTQLVGGLIILSNPKSALAGLVMESTASVTASGTISATEKWSMTTIILPLV